ncbi:MAG: hypothetical protein JXR79_07140 [Nitrospirae bacterium]|nr:hypothetical protein [Nitrospirota bacterium]
MKERIEEIEKTFYPHFVAEVVVVIFFCLQILIVISMLFVPEMGRPIDLSRQYQPRPEWYFLWLFELVKFFPGWSVVVGTVVVPLASVLLLMMMPFIDRGGSSSKMASIIFYLLLVMPVLLTISYILSH